MTEDEILRRALNRIDQTNGILFRALERAEQRIHEPPTERTRPVSTTQTLPDYLEILLRPYAGHPMLGKAITAVVEGRSDTGSMFGTLFHPHVFPNLSSGEQATLNLALALWNGHREARVADLEQMDDAHRHRAATAIIARYSPLWGTD